MGGAFFISVMMVLSVASTSGSSIRPLVITVLGATYPFLVSRALAPDDMGWIAWTMAHLSTYTLGRVIHWSSEANGRSPSWRQLKRSGARP